MLITGTLVDVRSVSTDGAKLDGIEDGATADPLVIGQLWNNAGALTVSAG